MSPAFKGKVVLVTGASRGIGKAACFGLAREGVNIVVAARTESATKLPGTIHQTAEEMAEAMENALVSLSAAPGSVAPGPGSGSAPAPTVGIPEKPLAGNPFTFGNPIRDPNRFYGREDEVRQIASRLLSSGHESTSIVGERRIGKRRS
jgi:NAD(P)-dependent dehydrogenase (short-subunit alcohol dehydrogenase family)